MPLLRTRFKSAGIIGGLAIVFVAGGLLYRGLRPTPPTERSAPVGRNIVVVGVAGAGVDESLLGTLTWPDVEPTAEAVGTNPVLRDQICAVAGTMSHPPARYLSGLLWLAATNATSALAEFLRIPIEEIPATHLYAPYRLHEELRPRQPNPFQARLGAALATKQLPPLIQARVLIGEGSLPQALQAYLKTDPAAWTDTDLRAFRGLRMHAGSAHDTGILLQAALRGGRLPTPLRTQVVEIVKAPVNAATLEELKRQFLEELARNPELERAAHTGAVQQLTVRRLFVGRQYRELLDQHTPRPAAGLPDETILLLTLAAARLDDAGAFDRWSQELKRRYPTANIATWLSQLRRPSPSPAP